jgi:hypothetical protein
MNPVNVLLLIEHLSLRVSAQFIGVDTLSTAFLL